MASLLEYAAFRSGAESHQQPVYQDGRSEMAKYEVDRTSYMDGKLQSNDIVLFRYADVLLMKAEAKVRKGENGDVELNKVRARVGMPNRPATLSNILESACWNWYGRVGAASDLIRFRQVHRGIRSPHPSSGESSGFTTVFPIPQKCIHLNPKLVQNKGYEKK